jgi:hypothetical protein
MDIKFNNNNFGTTLLIEGKSEVENELVDENSIIILTKQTNRNHLGVISISNKEKGKFSIQSSYYNDSDWVAYFIINMTKE